MSEALYTLKQKKDTNELHLFESEITENNECRLEPESICGQMKNPGKGDNIFLCTDEDTARLQCAKIGKRVCGICVSRLYASYPKK